MADSGEFDEIQTNVLDVYYVKVVLGGQLMDPKMDDSFRFS
jgi:hypothetical protein